MRGSIAIPSTCWAKGRAQPMTPRATTAAMRMRSQAIGRAAGNDALPNRPGISVKLSALHPRYEALSHGRVMGELVPQVVALARQAKQADLNFTIDAEEADRLELSLDVIAAVAADPSLAGWDGFGLAIQAYQKRSLQVIDWIHELAATLDRRFHGAAGQGRLLGHRGEALPGAWARRLSGLDPQGDDGPQLHGLRRADAGAQAEALSPVRDAQCADRRRDPREGGRRRRRLRVPAAVWHGRGALCPAPEGAAGRRLPYLCAGRGHKDLLPISCGVCSRMARTRPSSPPPRIRPCRSRSS